MNVEIKKIMIGARYEGIIYDYNITLQCHTGKLLEVFDHECFCSALKEHSMIECLIRCCILFDIDVGKTNNSKDISGVIVNKACLPSQWRVNGLPKKDVNFFWIETHDGIFLTSEQELESCYVEIGMKINFNVMRFDLLSVKS